MSAAIDNNYLKRAETLMEINRFREAIPLLTKAISEDPDDDWALCSISMCFSKIKDNKKALEYAEKAILSNPQCEWAYRLKGIMFLRKGQPLECLKYAQKAIELEPQNELALGNLVWAFLHNSKTEEADETAHALIKISPDSANNLYLKGVTESHLGNLAKSVEYFNRSLAIDPHYAEVRNALALVILKQSKESQNEKEMLEDVGLNHLTDSVKTDPNNEFVIDNVKKQLDNSLYYFAMVYLFPFFLGGLIVTPIVTIPAGLFMFGILIHQIRENNRRFEKLSPEMKNLFKIRNYASHLGEKTAGFVYGGISFLKLIWLQYLIALTISLSFIFSSRLPFHENLYFYLKLIFWGNLFWLFRNLVKYAAPQKG